MVCDSTKCPERDKKRPIPMGHPREAVDLHRIPRVGMQQPYVVLRFHDPCYPENIWPRGEMTDGGKLRQANL